MNTETEAYNKHREDNPEAFDATTLGAPRSASEFLGNRLWKTFMAGVAAGRMLEREQVKARVERMLFGN